MSFPQNVVEDAWKRAGGRCECRRKTHGHRYVRCNKHLVWKNRGREGRGAWEAHHRSSTGGIAFQTVKYYAGIATAERSDLVLA